MKKQITRIIETGKATIEVTMTYYHEMSDLDGYVKESKEIAKIAKAKLIANGNIVAESSEEFIYTVDIEKGRFGNIYITAATVGQILELLEEMHAELDKEFEIKTLTESTIKAEKEWANKVMTEIETRVTEILSAEDEAKWQINYNNIYNEGGEGYIPQRATLEDVVKAKTILAK